MPHSPSPFLPSLLRRHSPAVTNVRKAALRLLSPGEGLPIALLRKLWCSRSTPARIRWLSLKDEQRYRTSSRTTGAG